VASSVSLLFAARATPVQAGVELQAVSGAGALTSVAAQLTAPPGVLENVPELALLLGIVAVFLMSWRTKRLASIGIDAARGGSATERWREVVALLGLVSEDGTPSIEAHLGAIYTLEQTARGATAYRSPTIELLAAYVRHRASLGGTGLEPAVDVQSALTVLGRSGAERLDSRRTTLWGVDLEGTGLEEGDFSESRLGRTRFDNARLARSRFRGTNMSYSSFVGADL
jgi:hypothetical protein